MSGQGPGKRLIDGERTHVVSFRMPDSLLRRVNEAAKTAKTDRSKWLTAQVVAGLERGAK